MNYTLYKIGIKGSWKLWLIFLAVMMMYIPIVVSMFDPKLGNVLSSLSETMPEMMALFGMQDTGRTLLEFMASYLYGMVYLIFPMVYTIMTANRLIAKQVDHGSMAYLLASPVLRQKIVFTQLAVLLTGLILLIALSTCIGAVSAQAMFPGELDIAGYLRLNGALLMLHTFIAGICYLASCIFNDTKRSIALGAGIPVLCYMIQMVANLGGDYEAAKYVSFFTLFSPAAILKGEGWIYGAAAGLGITSIVLYMCAITIFARKDIPV